MFFFHNLEPNCSFIVVLPDLKCLLMLRKPKKVLRCPGLVRSQTVLQVFAERFYSEAHVTLRPEQVVVLSLASTLSPRN